MPLTLPLTVSQRRAAGVNQLRLRVQTSNRLSKPLRRQPEPAPNSRRLHI